MTVSYQPPPLPYRQPPRPWGRILAIGVGVGVVLSVAIVLLLVLINRSSQPDPISRAELMAEYAKIDPSDKSATPEQVDDLAGRYCRRLDDGDSTDDVIGTATTSWGPNATRVVQLFVSYGCTRHMNDFE